MPTLFKSHPRERHRSRIPCPSCGFERLIDTGLHTRSKTFIEGQSGYLAADYYQKCKKCKAEIGIKKIE
jgi:DNA-directed RNA polymerase subunit RPC12/RpoP